MAFVEYSSRERSDKVWRTAPEWMVSNENYRRSQNHEPLLRFKGLSDDQCSPRQRQWNVEARARDKIRILKAEALLLRVRNEIARS